MLTMWIVICCFCSVVVDTDGDTSNDDGDDDDVDDEMVVDKREHEKR